MLGALRGIIDRGSKASANKKERLASREDCMSTSGSSFRIRRRTFFGAGLAAGALQVFSPFVRTARAADAVKIGFDNPLSGPLASLGKNELIGCQMAIDAINAKSGTPGRPVELIVEDSSS